MRRIEFSNKVGQGTNSKNGTDIYVDSGTQAQYRQYAEFHNTAIMVGHKADLDSLCSYLVRAVWSNPSFANIRLLRSRSTFHA